MIPSRKRLIIILPVVVIAAVLTILLLRKWSGNDKNVIKVSGKMKSRMPKSALRSPVVFWNGWYPRVNHLMPAKL